jgi:photosystem II stability/assembly factor-like uncharacterized protein
MMAMRVLLSLVLALAAGWSGAGDVRAAADEPPRWRSMGPPGGDVYAMAADPADPSRIYLGTADGHIFGSRDGGESWQLLGRAGTPDAVITALIVDSRRPRVLLAAAWARNGNGGGGVFRSEDDGITWSLTGLGGEAVRALAQSPSHPDVLVAGTLTGVFRSADLGRTWRRISPEGHEEIRNLDSLAIDPKNPDILYAGTFHLPWKTTDGGKSWREIHDGMIDDSDVMSIIVDRTNPRRIYASACSGIYRSDDGGAQWRKIQGIPFSARRTHVIRQDPHRPQTIYAGTTEGLWKTTDGGATWRRMTPAQWVINSLVLHDRIPGRLVMGTERLGVQLSEDGGRSFRAANQGFHHRQIVALALDSERPGRVLAVLANAPEPVLATDDGGATWQRLGPGLSLAALRRVYATPDGWWAALERGGLMRYDAEKKSWAAFGQVTGEAAVVTDKKGRRITSSGPQPLRMVIHDMAFSREAWYAATPQGLLVTRDRGRTWELQRVGPMHLPVRSVRVSADGSKLWVVTLRGMSFSRDGGASWSWHDLPFEAGGALRLDVVDDSLLLATARNGLYISRDGGKSWAMASGGLPEAPVQDVAIAGDTLLVSMKHRSVYLSTDRGHRWQRIEGALAESFFPVVITGEMAQTIYAASSTDGLFAVELKSKAGRGGK